MKTKTPKELIFKTKIGTRSKWINYSEANNKDEYLKDQGEKLQ